MISVLLSTFGVIVLCVVFPIAFVIVVLFISARRSNRKQIRALRYLLPTNAERPIELHPVDLERLAVYVYLRFDYQRVEHSGLHSSTDGGVDVWLLNRAGRVEIVQCKQWQARVDRSELVAFAKVIRQQQADKGYYWAPRGFTKPAVQYAAQSNITLYDDYGIRKLLEQAVEVDKWIAEQKQLAQTQQAQAVVKKKTKKGMTTVQVIIIFGLGIALLSIACGLLSAIINGGS